MNPRTVRRRELLRRRIQRRQTRNLVITLAFAGVTLVSGDVNWILPVLVMLLGVLLDHVSLRLDDRLTDEDLDLRWEEHWKRWFPADTDPSEERQQR